jgi:hypothetical protein
VIERVAQESHVRRLSRPRWGEMNRSLVHATVTSQEVHTLVARARLVIGERT